MTRLEDIDPLRVCRNAANLEYRTIFFFQKRKFLLFCPPDWLHPTDMQGVYSKIKPLDLLFFLQL